MFYAAKINPIVLILFLVLFMCVLILQIYLSNRKSPLARADSAVPVCGLQSTEQKKEAENAG